MVTAKLNQKAPPLSVSDWVQGKACNFPDLLGKVVLVEVFQVNCPGCFLYSLPQAVDFHNRYADQGLAVLGVATAFEDFDKNTLENLRLLSETGQVIGETLKALTDQKQLMAGRLSFHIPFPLAMDQLNKRSPVVDKTEVDAYLNQHIPNFALQPAEYQQRITQQVLQYLQSLTYQAETFTLFSLQGTPSHILVDKKGILRSCTFGYDADLETKITNLLAA